MCIRDRFKISGLRDNWGANNINKIYKVLGFLVPPGEQTQYYIFAQKDPNQEVEEIECEAIDDYDYKVKAEFDGEKIVATIDRNEFDLNVMPKEIFSIEPFKKEPYTLDVYKRQSILCTYSFLLYPNFVNQGKIKYFRCNLPL